MDGTVPVPPNRPAFCGCVVVPSLELSLQRVCHSGGGETLPAVAPKSVKKNILKISSEIELNRCEEWNVYST